MTGLILKDLLILRKSLRSYLMVVGIYMALAFAGVWQADFVGSFVAVMVAILPMNVFAYDKQSKWDVYGLSLPVGRTRTVAARYLTALLLCLVSLALVAVLGSVMNVLGLIEDPLSYMASCAACGLLAMLMNAILLPFLYKFGAERARLMFYAVMGAIFLLGVVVMIPMGGLEQLKALEAPTMSQAIPIGAAAVVLLVLFFLVSFLMSLHFYSKQDV